MFGVRKATKEFCATLREILDENSRLKAENAKLRELCGGMCDLLPHADWPSTKCDEKASACIDQAIKLGIEV